MSSRSGRSRRASLATRSTDGRKRTCSSGSGSVRALTMPRRQGSPPKSFGAWIGEPHGIPGIGPREDGGGNRSSGRCNAQRYRHRAACFRISDRGGACPIRTIAPSPFPRRPSTGSAKRSYVALRTWRPRVASLTSATSLRRTWSRTQTSRWWLSTHSWRPRASSMLAARGSLSLEPRRWMIHSSHSFTLRYGDACDCARRWCQGRLGTLRVSRPG
jgi:hypothetical protein